MVPASLAELSRQLLNVIRLGTVAEVDHAAVRCRVRSGQLLSDWLPWPAARAGGVRTWSPPSVGEQCVLLAPGGDLAAAVVLLGINSDACPAPDSSPTVTSCHYPDGAIVSYDHQAHALTATLPVGGTADISAPVRVTVHTQHVELDAPTVHCTGDLHADGDVTAGAISLQRHVHGGVRSGPSATGAPQ